jgi:hypothetical protein
VELSLVIDAYQGQFHDQQKRSCEMRKNMGTADRVIRFLLAATVLVLYLLDAISGVAAIILGVFAVIFVVTSFVGFCPLYAPFNFSTKRES